MSGRSFCWDYSYISKLNKCRAQALTWDHWYSLIVLLWISFSLHQLACSHTMFSNSWRTGCTKDHPQLSNFDVASLLWSIKEGSHLDTSYVTPLWSQNQRAVPWPFYFLWELLPQRKALSPLFMAFLAQHLTAAPQRHRGHRAHPPCQQNWNGVQGWKEERDEGNKVCVGGRDDI